MQWIISSSVLIAVVIALRFALRGKISLRMQYALWLLVLVRLLVPVSLGTSDLSVMNAVPDRLPSVQQSVTIPTGNAATPAAPFVPAQNIDTPLPSDFVQNTTVTDTAPNAEKTDWAGIARTVWLTGAVVLGLTFLTSNLRFGRKLRRSRRSIADTGASLPVYESAETETPCLFGLVKPSIYITPDACADADTLRYALTHEQTHYRHGDHLWAVLRGVCLALHWYNPLVWWAAELSRRDAELACDEATIHTLGEAERAAYGRTLIRMTSEQRPALLVTATMMTDSGKGLRERITLLVKKPKTAVCTAALVLLIAGISVACTFTGTPKTYTVTQEWYDAGFSEEDAQACLAFLDWAEDFDVDDANAASWLAESGAADFKALDGKPAEMAAAFAQAVKSIRAEELSPPTDSSNEVTYTLSIADRRKGFCFSLNEDWQVALIAPAEYEADGEPFTYGKPVAMIDNAALTQFLRGMYRLTEKDSPTDFIQWCSRFRGENITNLSISVDSATAMGYTGETLKSMASELMPRLRALTEEQQVQPRDTGDLRIDHNTICLMIGDNKDDYMIDLSFDGNSANTIHVLGALRADEEGKYFRSEAYYDAPWIASWIRAKAIPLLEGDLPEAETMLLLGEDTYEDDAGLAHTVKTYRGEFPGSTRLTVGTFELAEGKVTFSGTWSPSYAFVCAIVKPSGGGDGAVIYFKSGDSCYIDFGQSGSYDIVLLAPREGIDGTVSVDMH